MTMTLSKRVFWGTNINCIYELLRQVGWTARPERDEESGTPQIGTRRGGLERLGPCEADFKMSFVGSPEPQKHFTVKHNKICKLCAKTPIPLRSGIGLPDMII